ARRRRDLQAIFRHRRPPRNHRSARDARWRHAFPGHRQDDVGGGLARQARGRPGRQRGLLLCDIWPSKPARLAAFINVYIDKTGPKPSCFGGDPRVVWAGHLPYKAGHVWSRLEGPALGEAFMPWKNQGGGPWGSGPKGPWGSGPQPVGPRPPDLEDLLRRGQDRLQQLLPGGSFSGLCIALIVLCAIAIWRIARFYRVQAEELGVVLRFGKYVRDAQPGLNYHLPYPIESVLLPKALRVSTISIGMTLIEDSSRRGRSRRDVPEESLMLTGDENIVDVDFTALWR